MSAYHYDTFSCAVEATPEVSILPQSPMRDGKLAELFTTEGGPVLYRRHDPARFDAESKALKADLAEVLNTPLEEGVA